MLRRAELQDLFNVLCHDAATCGENGKAVPQVPSLHLDRRDRRQEDHRAADRVRHTRQPAQRQADADPQSQRSGAYHSLRQLDC